MLYLHLQYMINCSVVIIFVNTIIIGVVEVVTIVCMERAPRARNSDRQRPYS